MGTRPSLREFRQQEDDGIPDKDRDHTPWRRQLRLLCDVMVEGIVAAITRVAVRAPRCEVEARARLAASIRRLPADSATLWLGRP